MKKIFSAILLLLLMAAPLWAQSWEEANAAYAAADYQNAALAYEAMLQEGALSGEARAEALYNLGNAYFKLGENARAILCYERCLRLAPGHEDAAFNLRFAESRIQDNIEDHHRFFLLNWAQALRNALSENAWFIVSVSLFLLFLIGMFVFAFCHGVGLRKSGFFIGLFALLVSLIGIWCGLSLHHRDTAREEAIITQGVVNAKSSPDKSGTDLFTLHEGTKVRISDQVSDWVEVRVGDNRGWIRLSSLERI